MPIHSATLPLKALTLTQPWATLMAMRHKRIETRSWSTNYRGPLVIHAAKGFPKWAKDTCSEEPFAAALGALTADDLPVSVGVCVVRLVGCFPTTESGFVKLAYAMGGKPGANELEFGDYGEGRYMWLTEFVQRIDNAQPTKGALGLWDYKGEI